jgi:membrane protease subunit HflK
MPWQQNNDDGPRNPWGQGSGSGSGGRGPQPPGIDELLKKAQDNLRQTLPDGLFSPKGFLLLGLLIFVVWIGTGIYTVKPDEQGVVLRFGKWVETTGPGLHYHMPAPIEKVFTPKVTVINRIDIGFVPDTGSAASEYSHERSMLTGDENIVAVEFSVFWRIDDAGKFLFNIDEQEETIKSAAESVMREIIGQTPIQTALTGGRQKIEQEAMTHLQKVLDSYGAGVSINQVKLSKVDPPESVIGAFRDVQAAQADKERVQNEAQAYQNDILPRARGDATKITQDAEAYRDQVVAKADGEASRFLSVYNEYKLSKDVTRRRMYLETMENILQGMNKMIIDKKAAGSGVNPYLPLNELQKKTGVKP